MRSNIQHIGRSLASRSHQTRISQISRIRLIPSRSFACENCACQNQNSTSSTSCSTSSEAKPARVKCDPYSQGGHPLESQVVNNLLKTLDAGWQTNEKARSLIRKFEFRDVGQTSMFAFVSSLQNLTINGGHPFYSMQVIPRKSLVEVELHTVSLHGLSYADFAFATQCDGEYRRIARVISK